MARLAKILLAFARCAFAFTLVAAALIAVALGVAWEYPDLWLRETTLARAARTLRPATLIDWASVSVIVEKPSFFVRKLSLEFTELRVDAGPVKANASVATLDATFQIGWDGVTAVVDDLTVEGNSLAVQIADTPKAPEKNERTPFRLPSWLSHLDVRRAQVQFAEARVTAGESLVRLAPKLTARPEGRGVRWDLETVAQTGTLLPGELSTDATIRLTSLAGPWFGPYAAKVYVRANDPTLGKFTLSAAGTPSFEGTSTFRGSVTAALKSKMAVSSAFTIAIAPGRIDFTPSGKVTLPSGPLAAVEFTRCPIAINLPFTDLPKQLRCDGVFHSRRASEKWNGQRWALSVEKNHWVLAFNDLVGLKTANARLVADITTDTGPVAARKIIANFEAHASDYAALAKHLYPGELSIPQPFASLAGDVTMKADWVGTLDDWARSEVSVPFSCVTKLESVRQRFKTTSAGTFRLAGPKAKPFLDAAVELSDVSLDLPHLELSPISVLPDGRIKPFEELDKGDEASAMRYRLVVKTTPGHPATLHSNLAAGPIPIAVDLLLTDDAGPRGSIGVLKFPVEFFHRRGELERLKVSFAAKGGNPVIDGSFRVRYAEYVITLKAIGPANKPTFEASSEPPLPQRDVWAALLFGRKLETDTTKPGSTPQPQLSTAPQAGSPFASRLSGDDQRSSAEMQAAAVDGGLSLASMYLLASTPVESVSYNPASHELRAAVRLADGASLTVGSDLQNAGSVGFRYRLGNNWYVTTTLEDTFDFNKTRLGTRLEWTRRY